MIATTIEQSKHLLELGLDPATADCMWMRHYLGDVYLIGMTADAPPITEDETPAWSLSALLEVMPKEIVNFGYNKKGEQVVSWAKLIIDTHIVDERCLWRIGYKGKRRYWVKVYQEQPINTAYQIVCFLLRQGYIFKKGGEQ